MSHRSENNLLSFRVTVWGRGVARFGVQGLGLSAVRTAAKGPVKAVIIAENVELCLPIGSIVVPFWDYNIGF